MSPFSAEVLNHLTAVSKSFAAPSPRTYIKPKLTCAKVCPCSAAF